MAHYAYKSTLWLWLVLALFDKHDWSFVLMGFNLSIKRFFSVYSWHQKCSSRPTGQDSNPRNRKIPLFNKPASRYQKLSSNVIQWMENKMTVGNWKKSFLLRTLAEVPKLFILSDSCLETREHRHTDTKWWFMKCCSSAWIDQNSEYFKIWWHVIFCLFLLLFCQICWQGWLSNNLISPF